MSKSIICTTYFSQKIHPNDPNDQCVIGRTTDGRVLQNDIKYIAPWYDSINKLSLQGVVFYDNLTEDFISKYQNENVQFKKVSTSDYSNNDWRFFVYRDFLKDKDYDSVFLTDGSDVTVVKDPHVITEEHTDTNFFICKDSINLADFPYINLHKQARWDNYDWFLTQHLQRNLDLINMGVIGGTYSNMLNFLDKFCLARMKLGHPDFNADMWVGQYVFRHLLSDKKILLGEPFTSNFKGYEYDRKDVYFIHK